MAMTASQLVPSGLVNRVTRSRTKLADLRVQTVLAFIEANYQRKITLSEMADAVNLSIWRFAHVFKSELGISPERYLTLFRLTRAKQYLETGFRSIKEIAALVGISDVSHFTKSFKNNYRQTPTEYRTAFLFHKPYEVTELPIARSANK
jgi:transcriptional regulator GlxA family with amidase domain